VWLSQRSGQPGGAQAGGRRTKQRVCVLFIVINSVSYPWYLGEAYRFRVKTVQMAAQICLRQISAHIAQLGFSRAIPVKIYSKSVQALKILKLQK